MPELIQTFEEALENARLFQELGEHSASRVYLNIDHFFHWYQFPEQGWFAPAKFIAYRDSTLDDYRSHGRHVHEAQGVLAQWFRRLAPDDPAFEATQAALGAFLERFHGHLHATGEETTGGIYVPK